MENQIENGEKLKEEVDEETMEMKYNLMKIIFSSILFLVSFFIVKNDTIKIVFYIIAYVVSGYEVLLNAIKRIVKFEAFDETVLMSIATIGAIIIGEYSEAVFVMVFYQIGELFQDYSMDKSRKNITSLVNIAPTFANVYRDGVINKISPRDVKIGETIIVNPYEKIPIDGEIIDGSTTLNTSALTGESIPRYVAKGDFVVSGLINNDSIIKIKTTKNFDDSTASKIINLIENATEKKSKSENYITSFAKVYTPIVCIVSLLTFLLPIIYSYLILKTSPDFSVWAYRALTILVISCPCAILISVPLAFFASIGNVSRKGILVKGSNYIEKLSKIKTFAFDKTGTMTKGVFEVVAVHHLQMKEEEFFRLVSHIEFFSNHPIAKSILKYYKKEIDVGIVKDVKEIGGRGLYGVVEGKKVLAGNEKLMKDYNVDYIDCRDVGTIVHVAIDNVYVGHILIDDIIKENAKEAIFKLKKYGVNKNVILTGDREEVAREVSTKIGIDEYHANLLPENKLDILEEMIAKNNVAFVGDGVNDAPCITRADVGIAMGAMGSEVAIDLSDIVIMDDDINSIPLIYKFSKKTMAVVYENITISIGIKVIVLILSIIGITNMWLAAFSDVGVMVIAVINSIRLLRK